MKRTVRGGLRAFALIALACPLARPALAGPAPAPPPAQDQRDVTSILEEQDLVRRQV